MTVREVDLSNNKFVRLVNTAYTSVPENVIDIVPAIVLPYLIRLDVSNNKLSKVPKSMEVPSLFGCNFIFYDVDECWLSLVKNTMYKHIVRMGKLLIFLER